jgi:hypothetical protein
MWDFYQQIWKPFAVVLADMEEYGIKINKSYLEEIEPLALKDKQEKADKFRSWAQQFCADVKYMNVNSDLQIRQLLFAPCVYVSCFYIVFDIHNPNTDFISYSFKSKYCQSSYVIVCITLTKQHSFL